mmetsp:Transcript_86350/g.252701  ORF Transcript_86350/g.252701 Transcript_86350/m.252701 type:complete len:785 (+) Transcript_86350:62-2416(+)
MGQKMCAQGRAGVRVGSMTGFVIGGSLGAAPGALVGGLAGSAGSRTGPSAAQGVLVGGAITGSLVGTLAAVPGGVLGGILGVAAGSAADLAAGAQALARSTERRLADAKEGRRRAADREVPGAGGRQVAQLPAEALPLLCAMVVARRREVVSEDEAFQRAAALASACAEGAEAEQVLAWAEREGRQVLTAMKLSEAYPQASKAAIHAAASSLVDTTDADVLDAAWIICGSTPLSSLCSELRSQQPPHVSGVTSEFMEAGLRTKYEMERESLVEALQHFFPGGPSPGAYAQRLDELREALPRASFWKAYCMFRSGAIPQQIGGLTFTDICTDDFVVAAKEFLATNFALCIEELEAQKTAEGDPACPVLSAAMRAAAPLAPVASLVPKGKELHVEILSVASLGSPQYRLGDLTGGLVRTASGSSARRCPYVEVVFGAARAQTRVVRDVKDSADFGECLALPCPESALASRQAVQVSVFDARGVQSAIRGDPLIGQASLALSEVDLGEPKAWTLQLSRGDRSNQGKLHLRIGITASEGDYSALSNASERPLAELARALANILSQPSGVDTLMETRPRLRDLQDEEISLLRRLLRDLLARLRRDAALASGLNDEAALAQLARTMRAVRQIVAMCAAEDLDGEEVQELAQAWIRALLLRCLPPGSAAPELNQGRLARLVEAGARPATRALEDYGASPPEGTGGELQEAVAARLGEALQGGEDEIFTGEPIFVGGRLRPGMAAVTRAGRDSGQPHIFLYDLASIRRWQASRGRDPSTRERLQEADILPLS